MYGKISHTHILTTYFIGTQTIILVTQFFNPYPSLSLWSNSCINECIKNERDCRLWNLADIIAMPLVVKTKRFNLIIIFHENKLFVFNL